MDLVSTVWLLGSLSAWSVCRHLRLVGGVEGGAQNVHEQRL